ncbi:hypothetical protein AB4Z09_01095 [Rhodococcus sp. TAF43]|uniref:hypothetical protein n=1 Tax=unclassified Rhodococcus (in: high G+C Gram-positive bacteria) TaxID=192944 RepID=UPI001583C608|nr:hypothetical protein [Rhodococcus sp. W8901]QKT11109.1 hypothetical protein HUN07_10595 [Rhodococcus sp. W8901]
MPGSLGWVGDPSPDAATWLAPYRYPDAGPASGWAADRFPYVLRILHPAHLGPDGEAQPATWAEIAEARNVRLEPGMAFPELSGFDDPCATVDGLFDATPEMGSLPAGLLDAVYSHFDDAAHGLFWDGWNGLLDHPIRQCARVREDPTGPSYQVVRATRSVEAGAVRLRTPNFWWPTDHSWCAATGIDDMHTLVVAADLERLAAAHADPRLETLLHRQA